MKDTKAVFTTIPQLNAYLAKKGVPKGAVTQIRRILLEDAITNQDAKNFERFGTAAAIVLHRRHGFGEKRISEFLQDLANFTASVADMEDGWTEAMKILNDEAGIIIRCSDDNFVEYMDKDERESAFNGKN